MDADRDSDAPSSPSVLHVQHSHEEHELEISPFIEEPLSSAVAPSSLRRRLYISHFFSTWNSRVFEFGAMLFFASIFPNTLLPMSAYALTRSLSAIASAPGIGRYIDHGDRLAVVRTSIVGQRAAVALSCIVFWILSRVTRTLSTSILGTTILAALACVEKPCSVLNLISVERDWAVVIAGSDTDTLQALNAQMRRIDLFCKLVGPLLIAAICDFSLNAGIYTVFGLGAFSVAVEYYAIAEVYGMVPELKRQSTTVDDELQPASSRDASASSTCMPTKFCSLFSGLSAYLRHPAFLPSFTLSLLYLTVLTFGGQMVTYLLSAGYTPLSIGLIRACSTCFEISATWIAPKVMSHIGPVRGGIWFLNWQIVSLAIAMQLFWTIKDPYVAASSLVAGVVLSRVGLWGFDLCAQVIVQEEVGDENRGSFSTTEASFQNAFELLSYLSTMVFSRPEQFRYPVLISCVAVSCAGILYSVFVRRRRGHLVHFSSCVKLRHGMQRIHDGW
ncbi:putative Ferriportin iron efflux transporter [Dentipellis sp. KUC8613]|nr:putative Ferriportin iron efflux transporter [Dentipellis sp. KUC8613]